MSGFIHFTKMHGAGNDYVYVNCMEQVIEDPAAMARWVSDRHFGIGSDGLVLILPSEECDFRMRMFNADGSEAEMCGNATRCVGKFVYDKALTTKKELTLQTGGGVKYLTLFTDKNDEVTQVRVGMGAPILEAENIPVLSEETPLVVNDPLVIEGEEYRITCVSMGNPHAVVFVEDPAVFPLEQLGPKFENHARFPRRTNTEFASVVAPDRIRMRVWERGAGETLACGTGACATLVAAVLNGKSNRKATLELVGGDLEIEWDEATGQVFMTGPAETVFEGTFKWNN